jgi:hypothetical protein
LDLLPGSPGASFNALMELMFLKACVMMLLFSDAL